MAKLRHIALTVPDPESAAAFYAETFELEIVGRTDSALADGVYLSDGTVCLALLRYKTDEAAGPYGKAHVGPHHLGFWCDDLDAQANLIERNGGSHFMDLPGDKHSLYFEAKFRDPNGVIFDISENGWIGATR